MSLRLRLTLVFAIGTAALVAISGLVFVGQLRSSLNAAMDASLRARSEALAAQLRSGSLPAGGFPDLGGKQTGQHSGAAADEFAQILIPGGKVVFPSGSESLATLLSRAQLRQVTRGSLTTTTTLEGEQARILVREVKRSGHPAIVFVGAVTAVADAAQQRADIIILIGGALAGGGAGVWPWPLAGARAGPLGGVGRALEQVFVDKTGASAAGPRTKGEDPP